MTVLLLFGCGRQQTDAEIQKLLVGTWRLDQEPSRTIQNNPDGSCILYLATGSSNLVAQGTWRVNAGFLISWMTNAPSWYGPQDPVARHQPESNKVVSIDQQKLTVLSSQDGKTIVTAHRQ